MTTDEQCGGEADHFARQLLAAGIPVVVCTPSGNVREVFQPAGWNTIAAGDCDLSSFRWGVDALAMVAGHGVDVVDVDAKAGGSVENLPPFRRFGRVRTPSGGHHDYVVSTGLAKISPLNVAGGHVGDYCGGTADGGGRLLVYLPGSSRPKYPGAGYEVLEPLDLDALLDSDPDDELVAALIGAGGTFAGEAGKPAAADAEVEVFKAAHAVHPDRLCNYGRAVLAGLLEDSRSTIPGDIVRGRHGWTVRSVIRAVELISAGCAWTGDLDTLEARLDEIKPEGGTSFDAVLAWAINNANGEVSCGMHRPVDDQSTADAGFWTARPVLTHIRDYARAKRVSPWALLGVTCARVVTAVPPRVVLPALVGPSPR